MNNGVLMFVLLFIIPAVISGFVVAKIINKRSLTDNTMINKVTTLKIIAFFAVTYYSVYRLLKILGGRGHQGYFETVAQMDIKAVINTYIRLGAVFVALCLLTWFWLKDNFIKVINLQLSLFSLVFIVEYTITGKMPSNKIEGLIYVISFLVSFVWTIIFKKSPNYANAKEQYVARIKYAVPIMALWSALMLLVLPNELFFNNINEISITYSNYLLCSVVLFLLAFVPMSAFTIFFTSDNVFKLTCASVFGVSIAGYIQELVMNGDMFLMVGNTYEWEIARSIINFIIWLLIILAIAFCGIKFKKFARIIPGIAIFVLLVRLITVVVFGIGTDFPDRKVLTPEGALTVSSNDNIIVLVLDAFDTQVFDQVSENEPEFFEPLKDFVFYDNLTSQYAYTYMAIPYLLTGVDWEEGMTEAEYHDFAFEKSDVLKDIKDAGYSVGVYTDAGATGSKIEKMAFNCKAQPEISLNYPELSRLMMVTSKYVAMPFMFKGHYMYTTDEFKALSANEEVWEVADDSQYYKELKDKKLTIAADNSNAFRFIHLNGAHAPFRIDENLESIGFSDDGQFLVGQAKGSMRVVYEYLDQLKSLGAYDSATIIITADHGQNFSLDGVLTNVAEEYGFDNTSSPILFVKYPGHTGEDINIERKDIAVTQKEIVETMRRASGSSVQRDAKSLEDISENDYPVRELKVYRYDIPLRIFDIEGNVHDINNWKLKESD